MSDYRGIDRRRNRKKRIFISLCKTTKAAIQLSLDALFKKKKLTRPAHSLS